MLTSTTMRMFSRWYLLIVALAAAGAILLLLDHSEYDASAAFHAAAECPDTSSAGCYQLFPGVIQDVRRGQTNSGEQDETTITTQGTSVRVSLVPSRLDSPLVQPTALVTVEWYVGSIATVWIAGHAIPSTTNLAASHANFAYVGWILLWLAALFCAILVLNRRMVALLGAALVRPGRVVAGLEVILPGSTSGWIVRSKLRQALILPLAFALLVLISIRPLMNPAMRPLAVIGDTLLVGPALIQIVLTLRNCRVLVDRSLIRRIDWIGRMHSTAVADIQQAALIGFRWSDWPVPALLFVGRDGTEMFALSSLFWNLDDIAAICRAVGIPLSVDYQPSGRRRISLARRTTRFAAGTVTAAFMVLSFLPLPPASS